MRFDLIKNQFKITKKIVAIFAFYILLTVSFFTLKTSQTDKLFIFSKNQIGDSYLYLLILLFLVVVIESLSYSLGDKLPILKKIIGNLLYVMSVFFNALTKIYVTIAGTFLNPILKNYLEKQSAGDKRERIIFVNQKIGARDDDHYFMRPVDIDGLKIDVQPLAHYPRWRFGLKFSNDGNFTSNRYGPRNILFHLTKEETSNNLQYHLYEEERGVSKIILNDYSNQAIDIRINNFRAQTHIKIYSSNILLDTVKIPKQQTAQVFAWADGFYNFELLANIKEA